MAKKRDKSAARRVGTTGWGFLLAAFAFGLLCVAAGVLIIVFGAGHAQDGAELTSRDVVFVGCGMIGLGIGAIALTIVIRRLQR